MRKIDNIASEMIPIRLMISISVIAAVTLMISVGYNNFSITLSENQIENEYRILESKLYSMIASGVARDVDENNAVNGTIRTHTFDLPYNLVYLAFGVDCDPNNDGIMKTGLTNDGIVIFFKVNTGSKHVIWPSKNDFRFREGDYVNNQWIINNDEQGFILQTGGKTALTFELVQKNLKKYILVHANDNFNTF